MVLLLLTMYLWRCPVNNPLDRIVEGMSVGVPIDLLRLAHPKVIIRDDGDSFKLLLRGTTNFVESTRIVEKAPLRIARTLSL